MRHREVMDMDRKLKASELKLEARRLLAGKYGTSAGMLVVVFLLSILGSIAIFFPLIPAIFGAWVPGRMNEGWIFGGRRRIPSGRCRIFSGQIGSIFIHLNSSFIPAGKTSGFSSHYSTLFSLFQQKSENAGDIQGRGISLSHACLRQIGTPNGRLSPGEPRLRRRWSP